MGWSQKSGWTYSNNVYSSYFIVSQNTTREESMSCITGVDFTSTSDIGLDNKTFKPIQYNFFSKSIAFKKEKNYQFNTIVVNYFQNKNTANLFSPPLYMITPFGRETGVFSNNLYDGYKGSTGSSDTAFLPHPYFVDYKDYISLNTTNQGRIFKLHYYSTPYDNITSYKTKNPIIYSSNNLFGKSLSNNKKNDGEGIVSFDINEINWFIQGYSYVSLHNITQKISYWKDSNDNLTGGILFGKGWYSFPNNMYVWFDGYFDYDNLDRDKDPNWQGNGYTWMFGLLRDNVEDNYDMRNQPVGGPWVGSPNVSFPGVGDYYYSVNVIPQAEPNKGSILNGTVKSPHKGFRENNYISKFINMDRYNFSINYHNTRNDNTGIRIYTSTKLPSSNPIQYKKYSFDIVNNTPIEYITDSILLDKSVIGLKLELDIKCKSIGDLIINLYSHSKPNTIINIFKGDGREVDDLNTTFTFDLNQEKISTILDSDWKNINNRVFSIQGDIGVGSKLLQSNTRDFGDFYSNSTDYFKLKFEHGLGYTPTTINKANLIFIYDDFILNEPIAHLTQSVDPKTYNFYGLEGNKHLVIVADKIESTKATHSIVTLKDLNISQSYHNLNNSLISIDKDFAPIGLSGTTYSHKSTIGSGNDFNLNNSTIDIHTMVGTGRFTSGIWENGNWINGWRDSEIYEFFNVNNFYSYNRDKKWVFSLFGPNTSIKNLSIGDKISISNIVAIDINENRTLLKNYFIIKNITNSTVVVEFSWDFPLRRIERDSENHYIYVTKNIWLNGYFFNGRFNGVWNNGVLISYPFLTKMEKTHWIDGEFSGGHFKSRPIVKTFSFVNSKATSENKLQIKFDYPHKLNVGDKVYINENFIGKTSVIEVIDDNIINFNVNYNTMFSKTSSISYIIIYKSDSLIQNMNFYSLNMSKTISSESMDSRSLFSFNSWMDLVYDSTSATNILKPQSNFDDSLTRYSENNLYGWITKDILSSKSVFRDSFSNTLKTYKLGYKYEKLTDYIGNASYFNEYFLPNSTQFEDIGWKRTTFTQSSLTFSRTIDDGTDKLILGKELKIEAKDDGGLLNIIKPKVTIKNRKLSTIEDDRYTMVSFDLVNKKTKNDYYLKGNISDNYYYQPLIHFSNLNIVNKKGVLSSATYLPVYKNVDHTLSEDKRKTEFFYNKKDLMMTFRGSGINGTHSSTFVLDNLKFYETDMIPFFQYFNYSNINRSIQIPIHIKRYKSIKNEYSYEFIDFTYANDLNSIVYSDSDKLNYINLPRYKDLYQIPTYNNFTKGFDWNNTNFGNDSTQP